MMVWGIMKWTYPRTPVWFGHGGLLGLKPPPWWLGTWLTARRPRWTWPGSRSSLASPCFESRCFCYFWQSTSEKALPYTPYIKATDYQTGVKISTKIQTIFDLFQAKLCKIKIFRCYLQVITPHKPHFSICVAYLNTKSVTLTFK